MDDFPDGASLKYTIGKRYSPSGKNIDKVGITPDVLMELDTGAYISNKIDTQLEKAKELLK
jgi:carboxyl-terminal processing protease